MLIQHHQVASGKCKFWPGGLTLTIILSLSLMLFELVNCSRCRGDQVSAGYSTTEYGCLKFVAARSTDAQDDNKTLIIGLAVGIGALILLVIVIIVIIVCVARSRRRGKHAGARMSYNNLRAEQSQYADVTTTTTSHSAQAQGTTRSFMFGSEHLSDKPVESVAVNQYWTVNTSPDPSLYHSF